MEFFYYARRCRLKIMVSLDLLALMHYISQKGSPVMPESRLRNLPIEFVVKILALVKDLKSQH